MDRKQLLEKIIAREAAMFIAVKASEPADCQEMPVSYTHLTLPTT